MAHSARKKTRGDIPKQVAALCYRTKKTGKDVLLVTSRGTGRWILPKGWPMKGKADAEAARIEAWEEAGVKAKNVAQDPIGQFEYTKDAHDTPMDVVTDVYPVEVADVEKDFPEAGERERKWMSPKQAAQLVEEPGLKKMLKKF